MPIPLSQLNTWTHQGAVTTSSSTFGSIRNALLRADSPLPNRGIDIFLQGSYANATNVYDDSDVDVVVLYDAVFYKDMSALTPAQQQLHERLFSAASYQWSNLRDDVFAALRSYYGAGAVTSGRRAIKVQASSGRRPAHLVPAVQFRRYASFVDTNNFTAHWGIQFFDSSNNPIVNYPKYHIERGEEKNRDARTRGRYKATVRLFKNFRNHLVEQRLLAEGIAPSYFVECMLYNVPDNLFIGDLTQTVPAILEYLWTTPHANFLCQNGVVPLFGTGFTQWSVANFATFVGAARGRWQNW